MWGNQNLKAKPFLFFSSFRSSFLVLFCGWLGVRKISIFRAWNSWLIFLWIKDKKSQDTPHNIYLCQPPPHFLLVVWNHKQFFEGFWTSTLLFQRQKFVKRSRFWASKPMCFFQLVVLRDFGPYFWLQENLMMKNRLEGTYLSWWLNRRILEELHSKLIQTESFSFQFFCGKQWKKHMKYEWNHQILGV